MVRHIHRNAGTYDLVGGRAHGRQAYIDMRKWFAYVPRWQWEIKVEYDGPTYEEDDYASGMMNGPSFADSQKGDSVTVEVTEKYVNGKLVDRYISGIE